MVIHRNQELTIFRHFFRWSKWYPSRQWTIGTLTILPFKGAVLVVRWKIIRLDSVVVENAEINSNKNHKPNEINFNAPNFMLRNFFIWFQCVLNSENQMCLLSKSLQQLYVPIDHEFVIQTVSWFAIGCCYRLNAVISIVVYTTSSC